MGHPHRLATCDYRGKLRVFLTACTDLRQRHFRNDRVCGEVISQLLSHAIERKIEVTTYCAMPDHIHILLRGLDSGSDLQAMIGRWKQSSGYWFRREFADCLWQGNYWDHVLREEDDPMFFVHYAVMNPVRSGLVEDLREYRWFGSSCWTREQLIEMAALYEKVLREKAVFPSS